MEYISRLFGPPRERNITVIVATSVFSTVVILNIARLAFQGKQQKVIKGPATTLLPKLSALEIAALPYPPDALPGARDVNSPVSWFERLYIEIVLRVQIFTNTQLVWNCKSL